MRFTASRRTLRLLLAAWRGRRQERGPTGRAYCRWNCNAGSVLDREAQIADAGAEKSVSGVFWDRQV
jgi:hypothetical protein